MKCKNQGLDPQHSNKKLLWFYILVTLAHNWRWGYVKTKGLLNSWPASLPARNDKLQVQ